MGHRRIAGRTTGRTAATEVVVTIVAARTSPPPLRRRRRVPRRPALRRRMWSTAAMFAAAAVVAVAVDGLSFTPPVAPVPRHVRGRGRFGGYSGMPPRQLPRPPSWGMMVITSRSAAAITRRMTATAAAATSATGGGDGGGGRAPRVTTTRTTTATTTAAAPPPGAGRGGTDGPSGDTATIDATGGGTTTVTLRLLRRLGLTRNLCTLRIHSIVEAYVDGSLRLGVVGGFRLRSGSKSKARAAMDDGEEKTNSGGASPEEEPRIRLALVPIDDADGGDADDGGTTSGEDAVEGEVAVVDVGQITTVWDDQDEDSKGGAPGGDDDDSRELLPSSIIGALSSARRRAGTSLAREVSVRGTDRAMEGLYDSRRGRGRGGGKGGQLTKKEINKLADGDARVAEVLRRAGLVMPRVVTSLDAARYIYGDGDGDGGGGARRHDNDVKIVRRVAGAVCLNDDAHLGGRFKRVPCSFVSNLVAAADGGVDGVILLNGGWQAVDVSVKSGAEGRKFARRAPSPAAGEQIGGDDDKSGGETRSPPGKDGDEGGTSSLGAAAAAAEVSSPSPSPPILLTEADERIAYRLECLAMGEVGVEETDDDDGSSALEMDAREALRSMGLPVTPDGARRALVRIGRWSSSSPDKKKKKRGGGRDGDMIQPWSEDILSAAAEYAVHSAAVRDRLARDVAETATATDASQPDLDGGRVDLTMLPCVCVDHPRTRFRDDAVGVRPRAVSGRKIVDGAGRWEVLVHIADVTDLYADSFRPRGSDDGGGDPEGVATAAAAEVLGMAAASRGLSRYDLPRGPLHLLPPAALDALGLVVDKPGGVGGRGGGSGGKNGASCCNRCVTLWAYVDERSGKVIDAGVERTVISNPVALSFVGATELLDGRGPGGAERLELKRARAVLAVAERNLLLWSGYHRSKNAAAARRESRLAAREVVSRETNRHHDPNGGRWGPPSSVAPGDDQFQRTRGHRVVDAALDLYGYGASALLSRARAPIPRASGSGADRGGRLGTAPLRRYIDGVAQRQIVAVLCRRRDGGGGGRLPSPMTVEECREANRIAARASNALVNYRSVKPGSAAFFASGGGGGGGMGAGQRERRRAALRSLAGHLATVGGGGGGGGNDRRIVPAIGTGRENEIAIVGVGAVAKCEGVMGSLSPGQRLMVEVVKLDPEGGVLRVRMAPTPPAE